MNTAHLHIQTPATRALLKFCRDHQRDETALKPIQDCLACLEREDVSTALAHFQRVPLGGNGCFNDWWPPVAFPHETPEYVSVVFESLVTNWSLMMRLSLPSASPNATVA